MNDEEQLIKEGYGWKRVRVSCNCGWEGRRIWGFKMFDKPCPNCKFVSSDGLRTSVYCRPHVKR